MQPYDIVKESFKLPVEDLYPFQQHTVNELAPLPAAGYYLDVGCGKTYTSIAACLFKLRMGLIHHIICLMPPVLITNWSRNLAKIPHVTHVMYRGSPAERKKINLNAQFILMSYDIFKRDYERLWGMFQDSKIAVLCDEAQAVKNVGSQTHKAVRDFAVGNHLLLLTGTPLSSPLDAYAYCKLISPGIYRNQKQFEDVHVDERDFFDRPTKWRNLELLAENLAVNSVRVLKEDVLKDLPAVTYNELAYDLDPKHLKLYRKLADEQLARLPDGGKIDLTSANALFHALLQIPMNAEHFSGGEIQSTGLDVLDEVMDELGDKKLVVFTNYRMTNKRLTEHGKKYNSVSIYGDISPKEKQAAIDRFISDPSCRLAVLQIIAAGVGIDGLHHVCSDILFLELPWVAAHFAQATGRLHRAGQTLPVNVRIALAAKTLQLRVWAMLQDKDSLVNLVVRGPYDLRDAIAGS